jgi:acyl-CoA dehydrogenase
MHFELNEEQRLMQTSISNMIADDFGPEYWRRKERNGEFPVEFWDAMARDGWLGAILPAEYGGMDLDVLDLSIIIERICAAGAGVAGAWYYLLTPIFGGLPIASQGTEAQKKRYLPGICNGEIECCMGLTEPNAGTNTLEAETFAEPSGNEFVINGQKMWCSGADRADVMFLIARTTPLEEADRRTDGLSLFLVDLPAEGLEVEPIPKLAFNYSNTCQVFLEDVRVPRENLLGTLDRGWYQLHDTINVERIVNAAGAVGTGELVLDKASGYASEREVFGQPIGAHQGVQFPLAELKSRIESARVLNHKAAWEYDNDMDDYIDTMNMAKFCATETAFQAADRAMQTYGGLGYSEEYDIERWWRELRLLRIAPVTQEMVLNYVGEHILGMPKSY